METIEKRNALAVNNIPLAILIAKRFCRRLAIACHGIKDDVHQEAQLALVRAARTLRQTDGKVNLTGYLAKSIRRRLWQWAKRHFKQSSPFQMSGGDFYFAKQDFLPDLYEAVEVLPENKKQLILTRYGIDRPEQTQIELANKENLTRQAIHKREHLVLNELRDLLL